MMPSSDESSSDDADEGLIQRGMKEDLRSILDTYPNNGQILKEIIQNAEDAGAKEIKFFLESCPPETKGKLLKSSLKQYQGPALYAYNDASFTAKDWEGIRRLGTSIKKNDPIKVGHFGLGFKSVFHITDLPSILSQDRLMILDPHQAFFKKTTHSLYLGKKRRRKRKKSCHYPGHLEAFKAVLDHPDLNEAFKKTKLDGTLFRFPLRLPPQESDMKSDLSDKCYDVAEIVQLLKSLESDTDLILLFMKTLNTIKVYIDGQQHLRVSLSSGNDRNVFKERADFLKFIQSRQYQVHPQSEATCHPDLQPRQDVQCDPMTLSEYVSIEVECSNKSVKNKMWLVNHYYATPGSDISETLLKLLHNEHLALCPLVGCAVEINDDVVDYSKPPQGHVSCVLPLPVTETSPSGLPVHVNGYFALDQNRAHLKWPTMDQQEENDPKLLWNTCVLTELVPKCYLQLVKNALQMQVKPEVIYRMLPDCDRVHDKWKIVTKTLGPMLLQEDIIFSNTQAEWVNPNVCIIDNLHEQPAKDVLRDLLKSSGSHAAQIPYHVQKVIEACKLTTITPSLIRGLMKQDPAIYKSRCNDDKHSILSYILQDDDFCSVDGLELLNLLDNSKATFAKCTEAYRTENNLQVLPIYLPSDEYPIAMFPNHKDRFLDMGSMEPTLVEKLHKVSLSCATQLRVLKDSDALQLILETEPKDWKKLDIVEESLKKQIDWCNIVSEYIVKNKQNIANYEKLHLFHQTSSCNSNTINLVKLQKRSAILLEGKSQIEESLRKFLISIGVIILEKLSKPWDSIEQILVNDGYINRYGPDGVLQVIADKLVSKDPHVTNGDHNISDLFHAASEEERLALQEELGRFSETDIDDKQKSLIKSLPIFKTTLGQWVCLNDNNPVMCKETIPIQVKASMIKYSKVTAKLASLVDILPLEELALIQDHILPNLNSSYTQSEIKKLMIYILNHHYRFIKQEHAGNMLKDSLNGVKCLEDAHGCLCCINTLYDPVLSDLIDHNVPKELYFSAEQNLSILKELGLKVNLSNEDIVNIAREIETATIQEKAISKSKALLKYLEEDHEILIAERHDLVEELSNIAWLVREETQMDGFPKSLKASYSNDSLWKPREVGDIKHVKIVGSSLPLCKTSKRVSEAFGWHKPPPAMKVYHHMQNLSKCYKDRDKGEYNTLAKSVYQHMGTNTQLQMLLHQDTSLKWIWHGNGFVEPGSLTITNLPFPLSPYIYSLPSEMDEFKTSIRESAILEGPISTVLVTALKKMQSMDAKERNYDRDLNIAVNIINRIARSVQTEEITLQDVKDDLLLPVQGEDEAILMLKKISECAYMYSATQWLTADSNEELTKRYVHSGISENTCKILKVPSLMSKLLGDDEGFGEDYGQSEDLTTRLKNILSDYRDGFSVPKELIQNADDAGASEVGFIYDERDNYDARKYLIDPGMEDQQGPALWVYNNATFSNDDFENIVKLGAATKAEQGNKIGKFGLGFNTVYNLTDVPSFVSGDSIVFFDPHQTFLGKAISGKPGLKIPIKKVKKLPQLSDQFKPYTGVFNCDLRCNVGEDQYDGTLFRFPLRQQRGKISNICYDKNEVKKLLQTVFDAAHKLMLFTQHVKKISIWHIPKDQQSTPPKPFDILEITKETSLCIRSPGCNSMMDASYEHLKGDHTKEKPKSSEIIKTAKVVSSLGAELLSVPSGESKRHWLVVWDIGDGDAYATALQRPKHHNSVAGVAISLKADGDGSYQLSVDGESATMFCFMPLPIEVPSLPFHINGTFAVTSSRRELSEWKDGDRRNGEANEEASWNTYLMKDSVVCSYIAALCDLKDIMDPTQLAMYYNAWPCVKELSGLYFEFQNSFLTRLLHGGLELFTDGTSWSDIEHVVFIDSQWEEIFYQNPETPYNEAIQTLKLHHTDCIVVTDIPKRILETLQSNKSFNRPIYTLDKFFEDVFFRDIQRLDGKYRNPLMMFALRNVASLSDHVIHLMKTVPAVPVQPSSKLKMIEELIDPSSELNKLYCEDDDVFPTALYTDDQICKPLQNLGMKHKYTELSGDQILERTKSVQCISDQTNKSSALERSKECIIAIDRNCRTQKLQNEVKEQLLKTPFLPIKPCPPGYPTVLWKRCNNNFAAAEDLFAEKHMYCASNASLILDESHSSSFPDSVSVFFDLKKTIPIDWVLNQMTVLLSCRDCSDRIKENVCTSVYEVLEDELKNPIDEKISKALSSLNCILIGQDLVHPHCIAYHLDADCTPYLYGLNNNNIKNKYPRLLKALNVKDTFDYEDYRQGLKKMHHKIMAGKLDEVQVKVSLNLVNQLFARQKKEIIGENLTEFYAPTKDNKLVLASKLCFDDISWIETIEEMQFAHDELPRGLGIKTKRDQHFSSISTDIGMPFGQKEELTQRLKNIIQSYPCDQGIMKEMLQNADDAEAKELHFILDEREHSTDKVFRESWKHLQGPALLVFNDKPFTEKDMGGIQSLGLGSKGNDPNKTGQYGIGFNVVYHLTDTPTFLTNGSEVKTTLCAFDPNLKYVCHEKSQVAGIQINANEKTQAQYPDVFECYKHDLFSENESTLFRLPLRTKQNATISAISNEEVTIEEVQKLLDKFKDDMFDALLFVNRVEKIAIGTINKNGALLKRYEVQSTMSDQDRDNLNDFNKEVSHLSSALKKGDITIDKIPLIEVSYEKILIDNNGKREKWNISRRFGFNKGTEILPEVQSAFQKKKLLLLPHGAVAGRTEQVEQTQSRAFCFLPLPGRIHLPVHVNGHFALDDARRNLFDDFKEYRHLWNQLVLKEIVVPAYISHIQHMKAALKLNQTHSHETTICHLEKFYHLFPSVPQSPPISPSYWEYLSITLYKTIANCDAKLLPVVRKTSQDKCTTDWVSLQNNGENDVYYDNIPKRLAASKRTFDGRIKAKEQERPTPTMSNILKMLGMNVLDMPKTIKNNFESAEIHIETISPAAVSRFLKSWKLHNPLCELQISLESSPFSKICCVKGILEYCLEDEHVDLENLPLCVRQDGILTHFSSIDKKFLTEFLDLVPEEAQQFIHEDLVHSLKKCKDQSVFCELTIEALAQLLSRSWLSIHLFDKEMEVELPTNEKLKLLRWIQELWTFIRSTKQIQQILAGNMDDNVQRMIKCIETCLQPLSKWAVIPCIAKRIMGKVQNEVQVLVPLSRSNTVFDHIFRPDMKIQYFELTNILKRIPILSLDVSGVNPYNSVDLSPKWNNGAFVQLLVTTLYNPSKMLYMMSYIADKIWNNFTPEPNDATSILAYFAMNLSDIKFDQHAKSALRRLPVFVTMLNKCVAVTNIDVYVIPDGVPTAGMDCWLSDNIKANRRCFIRENRIFNTLYKWLGFATFTSTELHCSFVFGQFDLLSHDQRVEHLRYIKDIVFPRLDASIVRFQNPESCDEREKLGYFQQERNSLLDGLRTLKFIADPDDETQLFCVSEFYDPQNRVFSKMRPSKCLTKPWYPFYKIQINEGGSKHRPCEENWVPFFRRFGLKTFVDSELFVKFAKEIESEAKLLHMATINSNKMMETNRTCTEGGCEDQNSHKWAKVQEMSQVLLRHLFRRENVLNEKILGKVNTIKFIAPHKVNNTLSSLHPQVGLPASEGETFLPYICFKDSLSHKHADMTWTVGNLLPQYANVAGITFENLHHSTYMQLGTHQNSELNKIKDSFHSQLSSQKQPSVSQVVKNWVNVSKYIDVRNLNDHERKKVVSICTKTFNYLNEQCENIINQSTLDPLKSSKVITVAEGKKLVMPCQLLSEPFSGEEIPGYLYKVPPELNGSLDILHVLGCTKTVTLYQLSQVMKEIYSTSRSSNTDIMNDPNALKAYQHASKQFFKMVANLAETETPPYITDVDKLYLMSQKGHLEDAVSLVCNDRPDYKDRLDESVFEKLPFMEELTPNSFGIHVHNEVELLKLLPEHLQPRMLSSMVIEVLLEESLEHVHEIPKVEQIKATLQSEHFILCVLRLIYDIECKDKKAQLEELIQEKLEDLQIIVTEKITTVLKHKENDETLSNTTKEKGYHIDQINGTRFYINSQNIEKTDAFDPLANMLSTWHKNLNGQNLRLLRMLTCDTPESIERMLDEDNVREYNKLQQGNNFLPKLGSYIPIDNHHLLIKRPGSLMAGIYVGYMDDSILAQIALDPNLPPVYKYAKILREVQKEENRTYSIYEIDIGSEEKIEKPDFDLYAFISIEDIREHKTMGTPLPTVDDVKKEISEILEEMWDLEENIRIRRVTRLMEMWQSSENTNREAEFCNVIMQHILDENMRLSKVDKNRMDVDDTYNYERDDNHPTYHQSLMRVRDYLYKRSQCHIAQREAYISQVSNDSATSDTQTYCYSFQYSRSFRRAAKNPQPGEAARWLKQAKHDLSTAQIGALVESKEWICYICLQAAEKALKAAHYYIDARNVWTNTHSLPLIAGSLSDNELRDDATELEGLAGNQTTPRYPNRVPYPHTPHDHYRPKDTGRVIALTRQIVDKSQAYMMQRH
ncbi:unnamed protein product [Owenia fusiformis]|uniref:Uncharacterized protein n=1 Tax=Owenia fusiformis TaxID=6347 RepID=A0A8J1TS97_OWEFU|nr:unnamed protein product [Owenia fusiformis]